MSTASLGKWIATVIGTVVAGLLVWWVVESFLSNEDPINDKPSLIVSAWYTPEPMNPGEPIEIFVKVLDENDNPVPGVLAKLTPKSGTFLWAASDVQPITGYTNQNGIFFTNYQTVVVASLIWDETPAGNSKTGVMSVYASKENYHDGKFEMVVRASN